MTRDDPATGCAPGLRGGAGPKPRGSRPFFGSLLLGCTTSVAGWKYVGHTARDSRTGARTPVETAAAYAREPRPRRLRTHRRRTSAPWTKPKLVPEVKFHRVDRRPQAAAADVSRAARRHQAGDGAQGAGCCFEKACGAGLVQPASRTHRVRRPHARRGRAADKDAAIAARTPHQAVIAKVLAHSTTSKAAGQRRAGAPGGDRLEVSNLRKIFWPPRPGSGQAGALTQGDLFRHYTRVAPASCRCSPTVRSCEAVSERRGSKPFYPHRAQPDKLPPGVRCVERATSETETRAHLLADRCYAALHRAARVDLAGPVVLPIGSEDTWTTSRSTSTRPMTPLRPRARVARWVREELDALKAAGLSETSGPAACTSTSHALPTRRTRQASCSARCPRRWSRRSTRSWPLWNARCRRAATASTWTTCRTRGARRWRAPTARAPTTRGVSTPLTWDEVDEGLSSEGLHYAHVRCRASRQSAICGRRSGNQRRGPPRRDELRPLEHEPDFAESPGA